MTFRKFDIENDIYDIEFHYGTKDVPDTNQVAYNPLVRLPDLKSWSLWFDKGTIAVYPYITEFIARSKTTKDFSSPTPQF